MSQTDPRPPRPNIGATVHYTSHGTPVRDDGAGLCVLNPEGLFFKQGVVQDVAAHRNGGYWHPIDGSCTV